MEEASMGQQFGDNSFDTDNLEPPKGVRAYDPDVSEIAHQTAVVEDALSDVEHAALQLKHMATGATARAEKLFGKFDDRPMPSMRAPLAPE